MNYCIFDIEVVPFTNRILEVAAIRLDNVLNIIEEIEVRTNVPWEKVAIGKYKEKEAMEILINSIEEDDIVIGYRMKFKEKILEMWGIRLNKRWDIEFLGKKELGLIQPLLSEMAKLLNIKEIDKDRALGDCLTMYDILRKTIDVKVR